MDHQCKTPGCSVNTTEDYEYCLGCRSRMKKCEYFIQKKITRAAGYTPVPWCERDDCRVIIKRGWRCDGCEEGDNTIR